MPGIVDVLLKITGDSRDAVRSLDETGTAAERAEQKVGGLQNRFAGLVSTIKQTAAAAGAIVGVASTIDDVLNQITQGRQDAAAQGVARAGTRQELETAFARQVNEAVLRQRGSPLERLIGRQISLPGGLFGTDVSTQDRNTIAAQEIEKLVATDPNRAAALAQLGGPYAAAISAELARAQRSRAFSDELAKSTTVVVNTGVGDPNRIGDEVHQALQRANRNNARQYQTTLSRP